MLQLIKNRNEKFEIFIQNRSPLFHIFFKYICPVQYIGKISGFFPGFTFLSWFSFYRRCLISYCMLQNFFSTDNTEKVQSYAVTQVTMQNHVTINLFPIFLM